MNAFQQLAATGRRMLAKIQRFYEVFGAPPKTYRSPRRSRVLIFDASWTELLLLFLESWAPEILHLRQERINVPSFLRAMFDRNFWNGEIMTAYIDAFIERVQPDLIITQIDNDPRFYQLLQRHPQIKTVAIQNGARGSEEFAGLKRAVHGPLLQCSHCCIFGANMEQEYRIFTARSLALIGQLKNNLVPSAAQFRDPNSIGYLSQYRIPPPSNTIFELRLHSWQNFYADVDTVLLNFLKQYAIRTNRVLWILGTPEASRDPLHREETHYKNLISDGYEFFSPRNYFENNSKTDTCGVVVSIDGTLGYESAARGNRTAFLAIRSHLCSLFHSRFGWPAEYADDGPFWCNVPDTVIFERIMDFLFAASDAEWKETLREHNFERIMEYDPGNTRFKKLLADILGPTPGA